MKILNTLKFAAVLGFVFCNYAKGETIFQIGTPDSFAKEFKTFANLADDRHAYNHDYSQPRRTFRDVDGCEKFFKDTKRNFTFVVGKNKDKDWPFVQPISGCRWSGSMQAADYAIRFDAPTAKNNPDKTYILRIGLADEYCRHDNFLDIFLNGKKLTRIANLHKFNYEKANISAVVAYHPQTWGIPALSKINIPAKSLKEKDNLIEIKPHRFKSTNAERWVAYDYISLSDDKQDPKIKDHQKEFEQNALKALGCDEVVFCVRSSSRDPHWYANVGKSVYAETPEGDSKADLWFNKEMFSRMGGKLVRYNLKTGDYEYILDDPDGSVRDCRLHYDAKKILFSYRKGTSDHFKLYEVDIDGKNLKLLPITGDWDDFEPCYMPNGDILYISNRQPKTVQCLFVPANNLHRWYSKENMIRNISVNPDQDDTPALLKDGRVVYMRWDYNQRSQVSFHHLWAMNPDGSNNTVFLGNKRPGGLFLAAKPVPDKDEIVFTFGTGHGQTDSRGFPAKMKIGADPSDEHAFDILVGGYSNQFFDPFPLGKGFYLTTNGKNIVIMDDFGHIFTGFKLPDDLFKSEHKVLTLTHKNNVPCKMFMRDVQPLRPRPREYLIPDKADFTKKTAVISLIDIYNGREMQSVKKGSVKKLLITEVLPEPVHYHGGMHPISNGGGFILERIWGTVPVEEDGSAMFEVPSGMPLSFSALDKDGKLIKKMQSSVGFSPATSTSCIGCHEKRTEAPTLTNTPLSFTKGVQKITPFKGRKQPFVVDLTRDLQPIFDKHCVKCHNSVDLKGSLSLEGGLNANNVLNYVALSKKGQYNDGRNRWGESAPYYFGSGSSKLMDKISGGHHNVKLSDYERESVMLWLDTGAMQSGTYAIQGTGFLRMNFYMAMTGINFDNMPETKAFNEAIKRRCMGCHNKNGGQMRWTIGGVAKLPTPDKKGKPSRIPHDLQFNFDNPERSIFVLTPLAKSAGGRAEKNVHPVVFKDKKDGDYQLIMSFLNKCKEWLSQNRPFYDKPNFRPNKGYTMVLQKCGIIKKNLKDKTPIPAFESDEKYFQWIHDTLYVKAPRPNK